MKKLIYSTIVSLLFTVSAQASGDPNDVNIQGSGVAVIGQECETCLANTSSADILPRTRDYSALLPDDASGKPTETGGADGTK